VLFFDAEGLLAVLRVMFGVFLIEAFSTTPSMILQKRLEFDKGAIAEIAASATNAGVAISLALAGFGVWSLVAGQLSSRLARAGVAFALSGFRPGLRFDAAIARQFFAYGRYLWAFAILSAVGGTLDRLILGRSLGAASLGMYSMALTLGSLPAAQISQLVNRITFPSFARVQDDLPALRSALHKTLRHVSILAVPLAFGMLAVADDLILTVYGEKWHGAIPIFRVLAFYGLSLAVSSIMGPVLKAIGRPQILLYSSILHHALLFPLIFLLVPYGAVGIAWAVVVPMVVSAVYAYALIVHYLHFPIRDLLGPLVRTGVPSLGMYGIVSVFDARLDAALALPAPVSLLVSAGVGVVAYLALSALLNRDALLEILGTFREALLSRRQTA
jgi:O-antigen/teichoic acid export membrane protein